MKRNSNFDLMRIMLCLGVVTIHSLGYFGIESPYVFTSINVFLLQANGAFYLISGYFNLEKEFNNSNDIKKFYKNRLINTFLPFVTFVLVWSIWDYLHVNNSFNLLDFLKIFYESIMDKSCDTHMWFLYPLFGLILSTPFLSKMLHNMDEKELKILWYVALAWNIVSIYLGDDLGVDFRYTAWIFNGWPIYYIGGYYYRHVASKDSLLKWGILGILGYALTIFGEFNIHPFYSSTECQIMFVLFCMGVLAFYDKAFNLNNEKVNRVIGYISKNTFMIYLFHLRAIEYVVRKFSIVERSLFTGLLVVVLSFIISLLLSIVANMCLKPIQKFIDNKWKIV